MSKIEVEKRDIYGRPVFYPANEQASNALALWPGQKTLTQQNLSSLKKLGLEITINQAEVEL